MLGHTGVRPRLPAGLELLSITGEFLEGPAFGRYVAAPAHVALERRLRRAKFEQQATLEGFDFNASPKLPAAQIRDLAALRWLHSGESVILFGPVVINGA